MTVGWHRPTKLIIDTQAITENVLNEVKRLPEETELFAVVKANGYGHGAVPTAKAAIKGGATGFCVALLDEAIELREAGIKGPILILGVVDVSYIDLLVKYDLSVTVTSQEWLEQAVNQLEQLENVQPLKIHIKVDTGMGRIGFKTVHETKKAVELVQLSEQMIWEGIFTHFSTADKKDQAYFNKQNQRFQNVLTELAELPRYVHVSNSATALWHPENAGNMIRFGIAMYGLNPSGHELEASYPLKPALSLVSELIHVKELSANEGIGYGKTYTTSKNEWIGTIPIGYADGWLRHLQGFSVLVNGKECEIVGRICMDQCMIRLPEQKTAGTKVTLIGKNGDKEITMQDVADKLDTIHYEVACTFSERIPREYR
jgi:alanine racemase